MAKTGPLGTAEKFYIAEKYETDDVDAIAKALDRAKTTIKRHINKLKKNKKEEPVENQVMINNTIPSNNGATVMTGAGSERGDNFRSTAPKMGPKLANAVTGTRRNG